MDKIAIGVILSSFGVKGFIKIKSLSGEIEHFFKIKKVEILKDNKWQTHAVESVKRIHNKIILKLEGINTPEEIKHLCGCELWVELKYAAPLKQGEFYIKDLYNCDILYKGQWQGKIKSVCDGNNADLLEVVNDAGKTILIPFIKRFIVGVDIESKEIHLREDFDLQ